MGRNSSRFLMIQNHKSGEQSIPVPDPLDFNELASLVAGHPFLQDFTAEQLDRLAQCAQIRDFRPGGLILKQGDPAQKFYLIVWGSVSLLHAGMKGNTAVQSLSGGDALGWSWLFPPYAWHYNAMSVEPTRLIEFDGEQVSQLCREQPTFGYEFMKRIAEVVIHRLQNTRHKLFRLTGEV